MADPNRALFESAVRLLAPVPDELVFVGGCVRIRESCRGSTVLPRSIHAGANPFDVLPDGRFVSPIAARAASSSVQSLQEIRVVLNVATRVLGYGTVKVTVAPISEPQALPP